MRCTLFTFRDLENAFYQAPQLTKIVSIASCILSIPITAAGIVNFTRSNTTTGAVFTSVGVLCVLIPTTRYFCAARRIHNETQAHQLLEGVDLFSVGTDSDPSSQGSLIEVAI